MVHTRPSAGETTGRLASKPVVRTPNPVLAFCTRELGGGCRLRPHAAMLPKSVDRTVHIGGHHRWAPRQLDTSRRCINEFGQHIHNTCDMFCLHVFAWEAPPTSKQTITGLFRSGTACFDIFHLLYRSAKKTRLHLPTRVDAFQPAEASRTGAAPGSSTSGPCHRKNVKQGHTGHPSYSQEFIRILVHVAACMVGFIMQFWESGVPIQ